MATQPQGTGAALRVANRAHWTFPDEEAEGANPGSTEPVSGNLFAKEARHGDRIREYQTGSAGHVRPRSHPMNRLVARGLLSAEPSTRDSGFCLSYRYPRRPRRCASRTGPSICHRHVVDTG